MKKKIVLGALLTGLAGSLSAQSGFNPVTAAHSIEVFDPNGRRFVNPTLDVEGSPFFKDEWVEGTVISANDKKYDHIKLRLNLQTQEWHFLAKDNTEMTVPKGTIKEILLYDSAGNNKKGTTFQCGFPAIDAQDKDNFYQVLSQGKVWLLRSLRKTISQRKDDLSGDVRKEFVTYEVYYLFAGGTLQRVKKDKSFFLTLLADKKNRLEDFINENKLKFKSADDFVRVIDYYNSLSE
ncbi:MAG TPA: hypothetical protein VNS58_22450 [Puia sp.]|nr:hypothetical protein [Puia sp.]